MSGLHENDDRLRLTEIYRSRSDAELKSLADDAASLTDLAREVLRAEIFRRGLDIPLVEIPAPPPAPPRLPIIRLYRDLPEALMAQSILDSAGIDCFLFDENIIRLNWLLSYAVGQIKLRVADDDTAAADSLLDAPRLSGFDVPGVGEYVDPLCPNCQSSDVSFRPLMKRLVYALLYLDLPIPLKRPAWRCHSCGYEWRTGEPGAHLSLDWNLIRLLWIVGLLFDFAALADGYGAFSWWFWWASAAICAVCLARYAKDRIFMHAFLVGLLIDGWAFFSLGIYFMRFIEAGRNSLGLAILVWGALFTGTLTSLRFIVLAWLATLVVPKRKSQESI